MIVGTCNVVHTNEDDDDSFGFKMMAAVRFDLFIFGFAFFTLLEERSKESMSVNSLE